VQKEDTNPFCDWPETGNWELREEDVKHGMGEVRKSNLQCEWKGEAGKPVVETGGGKNMAWEIPEDAEGGTEGGETVFNINHISHKNTDEKCRRVGEKKRKKGLGERGRKKSFLACQPSGTIPLARPSQRGLLPRVNDLPCCQRGKRGEGLGHYLHEAAEGGGKVPSVYLGR